MRDTTRHTILSVARTIFAHRGADNTTMDDLAKASGLGRRTIYTYFNTREELYLEVINREIDIILKQLNRVARMKISPEKKIVRFMVNHMKTIENLIRKDSLLRMEFLKRSEKIENFRKVIDLHEKECFASTLQEGTQSGVFLVDDYENTAVLALTTLKGLEQQFILDNFGKPCRETLELWQKILFRGIKVSA
ncbi:MAG TPA: helix-turn-helix domain-containing protein [Prolixibacteraceae bacterium]|nr:helix-turn-helix domain-containing protein [Prolixibacteraceae bacterium]